MTAPPRSAHAPTMSTIGVTASADEPRFSLSASQIMASMAAAVTAALVGSKLGVAGTVIGAGLASVISVVGGAVYGHSILFTRKQVKRAVLQVRGPEPTDDAMTAVMTTVLSSRALADQRTVIIPAVAPHDLERARASGPIGPTGRTAGAAQRPVTGFRTGPERAEPRRPRPTRRKLVAGLLVGAAAAAAIFVSSLAAVTLVETVKGSPLSGGDSGGLSVLGGNTGTDSGASTKVRAPTTTQTDVATVTQTVTSEPTDAAPATSGRTGPTTTAPTTTAPTTTAPTRTAPTTTAPTTTAPTSSLPNSAAVAPLASSAAPSVASPR